MKTILFACVHNAGRSQMAAALFNLRADPAKARAVSAGTEPGERVHPHTYPLRFAERVADCARVLVVLDRRAPAGIEAHQMAADREVLEQEAVQQVAAGHHLPASRRFSRSSGVSRVISSRERGPITDSTATPIRIDG